MTPGFLDGAFVGLPHPMFDFSEGLFDRVEIGRIGRQEPELGADSSYGPADDGRLVAAKVVHNDDVAGFKDGHELLLYIGTEALAVDRSVEDTRCRQPVAAQRAEEGQCAPMAVRSEAAQALAFRLPAAQRRHVGLDPRLIDEDQPSWVEAGLQGSPAPPPPRDVSTHLLKGEQRFF